MNTETTTFIDPETIIAAADYDSPLIIDLGTLERYSHQHLPNAVHLPYEAIVRDAPPACGLMPEAKAFCQRLASIGYKSDRKVLAYDDAGGGKASRLLFTLHALGQDNIQVIDGGLGAWLACGGPLESGIVTPTTTDFSADYKNDNVALQAEILVKLESDDTVLLDTRSAAEFCGDVARAAQGGHIPGAVHYEWTDAMDPTRQQRLRNKDELLRELAERGVTPDKEVIVYCQTHHRSAHTYATLLQLGFDRVKGYPGAWSEWGNDFSLPIG